MAFSSNTANRIRQALGDPTAGQELIDEIEQLADLDASDLAKIDGITNGTGAASKALVLDSSGDVTMPDLGNIAFGGVFSLSWDSTDANANHAHIQLPTGGATDVPVIVIGQAIDAVDSARYDGVTEPRVAIYAIGATATGPVIELRKSRGTFASPTVVTTGDDCGAIDAYGCVAAGEYVRSAQILFETAGTIATTRGPGTITFLTATDAAPSVLTQALKLSAAQNATIGGGAASQSLTFDTSGTDVVLTASSAALAMGAITLNVTGTRFVQSYHTNLTSTNAVTVDSSETVKEAITEYAGNALDILERLRVVTYRHKPELDPSGAIKLGIIAESIEEPLVLDEIGDEGSKYPGVNLYGLVTLLTKGFQEVLKRLSKIEAL